jgi:hypothetical protein
MAVKNVSVRIGEEMLEKLGFVAEYEGRSINSHILVLIWFRLFVAVLSGVPRLASKAGRYTLGLLRSQVASPPAPM